MAEPSEQRCFLQRVNSHLYLLRLLAHSAIKLELRDGIDSNFNGGSIIQKDGGVDGVERRRSRGKIGRWK